MRKYNTENLIKRKTGTTIPYHIPGVYFFLFCTTLMHWAAAGWWWCGLLMHGAFTGEALWSGFWFMHWTFTGIILSTALCLQSVGRCCTPSFLCWLRATHDEWIVCKDSTKLIHYFVNYLMKNESPDKDKRYLLNNRI